MANAKPQNDPKDEAITMKAGFSDDGKVKALKIKCNGELHELKIESGRIILLNHEKDDIGAEMVMARLGGRPCECVRFLMWEKSNPNKGG